MSKLVGQNLNGYELVEYIGEGSYGGVYKASHPNIPHPVVVKVLLKRHLENAEAMARFEAEATVIARLNHHPNVVPIYDYWREDHGAFLVLKYLGGGSLRDRLRQQIALPLDDVLTVMDRLVDVLAFAHDSGVIHRDLKPENVLFDEQGSVYLADFGIAKQTNVDLTMPNSILGTPGYLAPEQIVARPVSPQTDIYALGIMLYECLVGERPFSDKHAFNVLLKHLTEPMPLFFCKDAEVQTQINHVLQKAAAKKPEDRYTNISDMIVDLKTAALQFASI